MKEKFWMVLGEGVPKFRHESKAAACAEAERLARTVTNCEFFVMEAIASVQKKDVYWQPLVDCDSYDDGQIPF